MAVKEKVGVVVSDNPLSRTKRWEVVEILSSSSEA